MSGIADDFPVELTGFDRDGLIVGSAVWVFATGRWRVQGRGCDNWYYCDTEKEARRSLEARGAKTILDTGGRQ